MTKEKKMLIVDDAKVNRALLKRIFSNDYQILEAEDGIEAMELIEQHYQDNLMVILDLHMPKMDGFEVLNRIKADPRYVFVSIVVNTEYGDKDTELRVLQAGADDFISKPYLTEIARQRILHVHAKYELEQMKIGQELKQTSQQLQSLMSSVPGGIGIFELNGERMGYRYFNDGLPAMLGYTREEYKKVIKETAMAVVWPEDLPSLLRVVEEIVKQNRTGISSTCNFRMLKKDGSLIWVYLSAAIMAIEGSAIIFSAVFTDITENVLAQKKIEEHNMQLQYHVEHDLLTGLYNREKFCKVTEEFLKKHKDETCVMLRIDIERFKVINELFGSETGDKVLRNIAAVLSSEIGTKGTYGRLEADHFAVCIPQHLIEYRELLHALKKRFQTLSLNYKVNMYMGIYEITEKALSAEQMCERANMALDSVKGNALKKYAVYHDSMRAHLVQEQFMTNEMQQALKEGQFTFFLQPIYDAVTELPVSAEALVRWQHPERGMISPGQFIPLFERNGFIMKLDYYIWGQVCAYLSEAVRAGQKVVPVSVNVSRINLFQADLCEKIVNLVDSYHLDHGLIKFEITESAYINDSSQMLKVIETLQKCGFKVLMDDFGSGYSSLNMLKDAAVDILKIDMSFLESFGEDSRGSSVLDGVIRMAKVLNMKVVAEGVETEEQLRFLKNTGCDWIQGYYFSKPLPLETYCKLLLELHEKQVDTQVHGQEQSAAFMDRPVKKFLHEIIFTQETVHDELVRQNQYFDVVRLVDPEKTMVCHPGGGCKSATEKQTCYSIWGRNSRCANCISQKAFNVHGRYSKLEHTEEGTFFVVSQYIQVDKRGYVMEMVLRLEQQ